MKTLPGQSAKTRRTVLRLHIYHLLPSFSVRFLSFPHRRRIIVDLEVVCAFIRQLFFKCSVCRLSQKCDMKQCSWPLHGLLVIWSKGYPSHWPHKRIASFSLTIVTVCQSSNKDTLGALKKKTKLVLRVSKVNRRERDKNTAPFCSAFVGTGRGRGH